MTLRVFSEAFGNARLDGTLDNAIDAALAVQTVVDALRDHATGQRYQVGFSTKTIAATVFGTRRIVVTPKPILDQRLSVAQACTVMTGLTLHEIGHTVVTKPIEQSIDRKYGRPGLWGSDPLAFELINIGDDNRLERYMEGRYPIAKGAFLTTAWWVALETGMLGRPVDYRTMTTTSERMRLVLYATRYPFAARWSDDLVTATERGWWEAWNAKYEALPTDNVRKLFRLIDEGLERLRQDLPEPPPPQDQPVQPGADPDDEPGDQPGGGTPVPTGDDDGEPGDLPGGNEWGDDEGKGKGQPSDEDGEPGDGTTPSPDGEPGDDPTPGGDGNPAPGEDGEDNGDEPGAGDGNDGDEPAPTGTSTGKTGDGDKAGDGPVDGDANDGVDVAATDDLQPGHSDTDTGTSRGRVTDDSRDRTKMPTQQDALTRDEGNRFSNNEEWSIRQKMEQRIEETRRITRVDTAGYGTARVIVEEV